jgi:hypothetical protein
MSQRESLFHIAAGMNRNEKSNTLQRPIMPLCQDHQLSVCGLPSNYSATAKREAIALHRRRGHYRASRQRTVQLLS